MKIKKDFSTHLMMKEILEILKEKGPPRLEEIEPQESKGPILVVDDNNEIRDVLWAFLTKRGYNVLMASSGEEALMRLKTEKERPRVILLDIRMPGMDGIMVLKQIKELDETIDVVMLTSAQDEYIMKEAKDVGASDYLSKPCDFSKLDALLLSLLVAKKEFRKNKGECNGTET
jgi:two-component system response regulator (stage 0 sporulation protein F)